MKILLTTVMFVHILTTTCLISGCRPAAIVEGPVREANQNKTQLTTPTPVPAKTAETLLTDFSDVPTVTYCEMVQNPAKYDRQIVRVRGVYFNGFERMFFYDQKCEKDHAPEAPKKIPGDTWIEWNRDYEAADKSPEAKEYIAVKSEERKDVTVIGRFYGTKDLNTTGSGKYELQILRIEKIKDL